MTNHLLLIGAGFSHNWGGWLASRFFDVLFGDTAVQDDSDLRELLWRYRTAGGFEAALADLQAAALSDPELAARRDAFEGALRRVFAHMNAAFFHRQGGFEFNNQTGWFVRELLVRFDAIFSLNQDLLLERFYLDGDDIALTTSQRLLGAALPGVRWPNPKPTFIPAEWEKARWTVDGPIDVPKRTQPVYKLHGSSNWVTSEGRDLLVLGGAKTNAIAGAALLSSYFEEFRRRLSIPDTRLIIIGYGFGDAHINEALRAAEKTGLKIFVIDPAGAGIFDKLDDPEPFRRMFIGASPLSLRETFSGNVAERDHVFRFFKT
jgi:hypothetical protein